jgi:hypothetical protein
MYWRLEVPVHYFVPFTEVALYSEYQFCTFYWTDETDDMAGWDGGTRKA